MARVHLQMMLGTAPAPTRKNGAAEQERLLPAGTPDTAQSLPEEDIGCSLSLSLALADPTGSNSGEELSSSTGTRISLDLSL
jgi:hypothetical protein